MVAHLQEVWMERELGMRKKKFHGQRGTTGRTLALVLLVMIGIFSLISIALPHIGITGMDSVCLDDKTTISAVDADGEMNIYKTNEFRSLTKGAVLTVKVPLPEKEMIPYSCLCFFTYNSYVRVYYGSELLYSHGAEERKEKKITGHVLARVPIPNEAWGGRVQIVIEQLENNTDTHFYNVYAIDAAHAWLYPLVYNGQLDFAIFATFLLMSIVMFLHFVFMRIMGGQTQQGIFLSLFCISISVWDLGYSSLIYLISDNPVFTSKAEYPAVFVLPVTFCGYMIYEDISRRVKLICKILFAIYFIVFYVACATEHMGIGLGYSAFINAHHILLGIGIAFTIFVILTSRSHEDDLSKKVLRIGTLISLVVCVLELVRIFLMSYATALPDKLDSFLETSYAPMLLIIFESSLIISYTLRLINALNVKAEKDELEKLAFVDVLTGIPNRTSVKENLAKLDETPEKGYSLFFLDVDYLKEANDKYGHDMGDKMLILVAKAITQTFGDVDGFYGRYGGDEFIACVYDQKQADRSENEFERAIMRTNKIELLPFPIIVAVGRCDKAPDENAGSGEILRKADARMYEVKAAQKGKVNVR